MLSSALTQTAWDALRQVYKSAGTLHTASINAVAWAPYELGLVLASASSDGTVAVLEYKDGTFETTKVPGPMWQQAHTT